MASIASSAGAFASLPARQSVWLRWLVPSFSDLFFVSVLVWLFVAGSGGWTSLLLDGDAGWHIRVGEYVLDNGKVPSADLFSFTRPGEVWYAWEWLSDVVYGGVHRVAGLKGVVLVAGVVIALFAVVLFRHVLWAGANLFAAMPVVLLAVGASTLHHLARPHVFTLLFFAASLWLIDRDRRRADRWVWVLIPVSVVWTNLHGGFFALVATLGLLTVGTAAEEWVGSRTWTRPLRYALLSAGCLAASVVNPFGIQLHLHIASYLRSDWIRNMVQEFQSPNFRSENLLQAQALLFMGLMAAALLLSRRRFVEVLWILFWAHSALGSARHVPLFAIVAAPVIAFELTRLWNWTFATAAPRSLGRILADLAADNTPGAGRVTVWALAPALLLVLPLDSRWPKDFPEAAFPVDIVNRYQERLIAGRVFTSDQWADYLIYRSYPRQRVFIDGRSDFFGPELGNEYLQASHAQWRWREILDKYRIDTVLGPPDWPLITLLKGHRDWQLITDSGKAVLLSRRRAADRPGGIQRDASRPNDNR
ncbi:MAG: hypothetical protein SFV54_01115 [Bryobacteraceae bacterium]|nr:hypothetical protein [Bryobacteraceae bacterium]